MKKNIPFSLVVISLLISNLLFAQDALLLKAEKFSGKLKTGQNPVLIDVRSEKEFEENHIPQAQLLQLQGEDTAACISAWHKDQTLLLYSISNGRSVQWARYLRSKGYTAAYALDGGVGAWVGAGYKFYSGTAKNNWTIDSLNQWKKKEELLLVDIGSRNCPPCVKLKSILDKMHNTGKGGFSLKAVDLNDNPGLVAAIGGVDALPTLILFKDGEPVWRKSGVEDFRTIEDEISTEISKHR